MKIYFAGSWHRKNELREIRDNMLDFDPSLDSVSSWLNDPDAPHDNEGLRTHSAMQADAIRDAKDVDSCDLLILFTSDKPEYQVGGGRFWEFGRAYALGKGCIVVGPQEQIFETMPYVGLLDNPGHLMHVVYTKNLAYIGYMKQVWKGVRSGNL